jgi:NAD(P)-dependent dehydrogenase (short-subunit alcohol dehydrogenase family)
LVAEGAKVVVLGRAAANLKAAQRDLGGSGIAFVADAVRPGTAERAIKLAVGKFGSFDGLYHVAGGSGRKMGDGPLHEMTDEGWRQTVDLNLSSLVYSNRAAVRQFLAQKTGGAILNMGSVLGSSPSPRYFATHAYAAAKSGITGFSRAIASYYAPNNIRCNVLAPGLIETPMARRAAADKAIRAFIKRKQPLDGGRIGQPGDLDAAAVFFMSEGSKFVTGQVLTVDGGWTLTDLT